MYGLSTRAKLVYQLLQDILLSLSIEHNIGGAIIKKVLGNTNDQTCLGLHLIYTY
jgi:hypothetical protein